MEGWVGLVNWPIAESLPIKSTIDRAQVRENAPAEDQRPNHWTTPPTTDYLTHWHAKHSDAHEAKMPVRTAQCNNHDDAWN